MNVYLVGFRGVGKTTVAPLLAERLGRSWLDLDSEIERREGVSIAAFFDLHGEDAFRERECEALQRTEAVDNLVVATGGGVVLRPSNRIVLRRGFCIWLQASVETLVARLEVDAARPRLTNRPLREEIEWLLAQREPFYREVANCAFDLDAMDADQASDRIAAAVRPSPR